MYPLTCACGCGEPARRKWASERCRRRMDRSPSAVRNRQGKRADGTKRPSRIAHERANDATRTQRKGGRLHRLALPFVEVRGEHQDQAYRCTINGQEAPTDAAKRLGWLVEQLQDCQPITYGLTANATMWLADLDDDTLRRLMDRESRVDPARPWYAQPVFWRGFCLDYLPLHFFWIRDTRTHKKVRISDVSRFFGTPYDEATRTQTVAELMQDFRAKCIAVNIIPKQWEGPGQGASVLLKRWGIRDHLAAPPEAVTIAASHAYHGHRFELAQPGLHPKAVQWDLRAAYPWAATQLPCFAHGEWVQWDEADIFDGVGITMPTLRLVGWRVPAGRPFGPFPWRYPSGETIYPCSGTAWVWGPEWDEAQLHWPGISFQVYDAWSWVQSCNCQPWEALRDTMPLRSSFPQIKRMLNCCPGKLAQSRPVKGPWFDPCSAGLVTSIVRAHMLRLASIAGNQVIGIVADALWTRRSFAGLSELEGPEPGDLRRTDHRDVLAVAGGGLIYEGQTVSAAAGTPARRLDGLRDTFEAAWSLEGLKAAVGVSYEHLITPDEHLTTGEPTGTWVTRPREIRFAQGDKRAWSAARHQVGRAITLPVGAPDQTRIMLTGDPTGGTMIGDRPLGYPYWDAQGRPLCPPPDLWPSDADELES